ncbi:MAG: lamin tail domain-containing protein [Pirellulales bacterium]|nr:lamin tail domain-containing protein [Pirellulales bacterium]
MLRSVGRRWAMRAGARTGGRLRRGQSKHSCNARLRFEPLETRLVLDSGTLIISEFMAINGDTLADAHGHFHDWIEIYNPTGAEVHLDGWYLTDDGENLTKWEFPEDAAVGANDYLIVFASEEHLDPPPGELHANFKIDGDGEYLALVEPDGRTIAHAYAPEFPRQLEDVSYGLPSTTTLREEYVVAGAAASFHVPGPGDDLLAWTTPGFDDSAWVDTVTLDPAALLITEVATGEVQFVEVQNVSAAPVATSGWSVLANDASAGISGVNPVAWSLPASVAEAVVLYRTDQTDDHYWGGAIDWQPEGPGWVMILDDAGKVMDFVAWGYTAAEVASLEINYGGFSGITVEDQWSGNGAAVGTEGPGGEETGFVAFNDHMRGSGTHENTTTYTPNDVASGLLKDIETGLFTEVTLTTSQSGVSWEGTHGNPAPGTDAYSVFHDYVDFSGASGSGASIAISGADHITHTFAGLDTGDAVTYSFAGTTVRGRDGYTDRWTRVTLEGAASATAAHSSGHGVVVLSPTEVAILTGENHLSDQGFLAAWTDIDPGPDGEFAIVSRQYTGDTPLGDASGSKGYGIAGLRLEEVIPAGPRSWLKRTGNVDTDTAAAWIRTTEPSPGLQNPDLTVPFGTVLPAHTGLGFSNGQPEFEGNIQTDVGEAMHGVNASLWARIEFEAGAPSQYDEMTLRMKCDDGFVAYLNGVEVARKNAPDLLAHDSAAIQAQPDPQTLQFEEFGIGEFLDVLQTGANVLAIHGLNVDAADDDFLLLPELIAATTLAGPQYMTEPTPGGDNLEGAMGVVADTRFSVDRGFFDEAFELEITTSTAGAEIRYTTDGSPPTSTTGNAYTASITISGTTTVRAAAFKPGFIPTNVDTHTYLFPGEVAQQPELPTGYPDNWGHDGADYAMDPDVVNAAPLLDRYGNAFDVQDALQDIPTLSLVMEQDNWFGAGGTGIYPSGEHVPKAVSAELIYPDGSDGFQIDCSVEIVGGSSTGRWKVDKLSMRLKFREPYGPSRLDFPLYPDSPLDSYNTIVIDAMMNLNWLHPDSGQRNMGQCTRDQYVSDIQDALGGYGTHGFQAHLYLNGIYWGMHWLHERPDESFAADYFGGEEEDYDVIKHSYNLVVNGTNANYREMFNIANAGLTGDGQYALIQEYLDVPDFIDYMITNYYVGNTDWADHNWYATRNRVDPDGRWRFHSWDAEHVLKGNTDNVTGNNVDYAPTGLQQRLAANAEYRLLFADHVHRHFFNDGILTAENAAAMYQERLNEIDRAIVAESARWGDNRVASTPYTRNGTWMAEANRLLNSYFPQRTNTVLSQLKARGLYPSVTAPTCVPRGGEVTPGYWLSISAQGGTIYYTVDGSDPRLPGGAVNTAHARIYSGAIPLNESCVLKARVLSGGRWSALNEAEYVVRPAGAENLVISEINYNPYDPTDEELLIDPAWTAADFEFVELQNTGSQSIDLKFARFDRGIAFDFAWSDVTQLAPQQSLVVVANQAAFAARYGTGQLVAGQFEGTLDNAGEGLTLLDWADEPILDFAYNDSGDWPGRADGKGASLELLDPAAVPATEPLRTEYLEDGNHWRSSSEYGGSPGMVGDGPVGGVVINEVLSHTDVPLADAIELHNTTGAAIDVGGWYLSDSWGWDSNPQNGDYKKFRISDGTTIPSQGYIVFDEDDFNPTPLAPGPKDFALDGAHGDDVWLMGADASGKLVRFIDHVEFGAAKNGESFGRYPNGSGDLCPMQQRTLNPADGENSQPRVGPVIISEVHYNPDPTDLDDDLEFIEIYNPTAETADLTDWRIRKGIDFDFAAGTLLGPRSVLVVVPFNPSDTDKLTAFRTYYGMDASVRFVGGYSGQLRDVGERVQLQRPDAPPADDPDFIPRLWEDEVVYAGDGDWPVEADGGGSSLHRAAVDAWGNAPASWDALLPTPGQVTLLPSAEVVGRHVFYNTSAFDGNSAAANALDDNAIAPDKEALLPGQTATLANYTSYFRGINGLMIDIAGLPGGAVLGTDDFLFRVGNSSDPSTWEAAAVPTIITVRPGDGVDGSDRVTIVWADYAIAKQWLQATVLVTDEIGLADPDVFYFGNAVGEAGNSTADARINATDMLLARNNPRNFLNPAPLDFPYDFNRDARVNATDMLLARNNQTHFLNALRLITVPDAGEDAVEKGATAAADETTRPSSPTGAGETAGNEILASKWGWLYEFEELADSGRRDRQAASGDEAWDETKPGVIC